MGKRVMLQDQLRTIFSAFTWGFLFAMAPSNHAVAQSQCEQVRAHTERLRQHVDQQRARGVPREQLNADIEIYNRWVITRDRVCSGGGGGTVSGGGSRQQTIGELQRLIGLLGAMNSQAPGAADFERELQAQLEAEERAQRAAEAESARRRVNTTNPFTANTNTASGANPFSTSPPSHRLPTIPGTTFDTKLVETKPTATNPFADGGCPSDTPGVQPGGAITEPGLLQTATFQPGARSCAGHDGARCGAGRQSFWAASRSHHCRGGQCAYPAFRARGRTRGSPRRKPCRLCTDFGSAGGS